MAQVLAITGHVRHGFSYIVQFNHDFGRITGISATIKGNILLCDYDKKNVILVDSLGNYLKKLHLDSEPYDVAVTSQNIGHITQPYSRSVLQIDPDRMMILFKATCDKPSTTVFCVSAILNTGRDFSEKASGFLGVKKDGFSYPVAVNHDQFPFKSLSSCEFKNWLLDNWQRIKTKCPGRKEYVEYSNIRSNAIYIPVSSLTDLRKTGQTLGSCVIKFHTVNEKSSFSCIGGQSYIMYYNSERWGYTKKIDNIATMDTLTDICSDDNGHIYVSRQGSNNIHRLEGYVKDPWELPVTTDRKVLDIPLDSRHGIKEPVALCFNQDYSKLFIVNEWGKSVLVFDVI